MIDNVRSTSALGTAMLEKLGITAEQVNRSAMFHDVRLSHIAQALANAPVVRVDKGSVIIRAGQQVQRMYVIVSGSVDVRLESPESPPVAHLDAGEIFGEFSIIDGEAASAFVKATQDCTLIGLDRETLWQLFEASPQVANNLLTILVSRVRSSNLTIRRLQAEVAGEEFDTELLQQKVSFIDDPTVIDLP